MISNTLMPGELIEIIPADRVIRITQEILDQNRMILTLNAKLLETVQNSAFLYVPKPEAAESDK